MEKIQILPSGISWNQNTYQAKKEEKIKEKKKKKKAILCLQILALCDRCLVMPADVEFFGRIVLQIA